LIGCGRIFVGAFDPQHIRVLEEGVLELLRNLVSGTPASCAPRIVLSSTSVIFITR